MKNLLILIILLSTSSLFAITSSEDPLTSMPLSKMFWSLFQERNVIGQNDCSNKCGRYTRALQNAGHQADILVIRPHRSQYLHAIVKVEKEDGSIVYLDPTKGIISYKVEDLGALVEKITFETLETRGLAYK
ncbi:MAG: hypothetical protein HRT88_19915 [Lentisphaeraceae bacterium]|nr:hypothetical protein [Lentisphaeraceae bacterium]